MNDLSLQPERDLDIRNLIFAVMRKWRFILVFSVICALIPGLFSGISGIRKLHNSVLLEQTNLQAKELKDNYEQSLSNLSAESDNIKEQIQHQKEYKNRSYILNMDPSRVYKYSITYNLNNTYTKPDGSTATNGNVAAILNSYTIAIKNMDIDSASLPSRADKKSDVPDSINTLIVSAQDNNAKTLTFTVSAATPEDAEVFLNEVAKAVEANQATITSKLGQHTLTEVLRKAITGTDNNVNTLSTSYTTNLNSLQTTLTNVTKQLTDLKEPTLKVMTFSSVIASARNFAILGLVLGLFLSVFITCVRYLVSDRITGTDEFLRHCPQLTMLGAIPRKKGTGLGHRIDAAINRWEDPTSAMDSSAVRMSIAAKMEAVCGTNDLLLLGESKSSDAQALINEIHNLLSSPSITQLDNLSAGVDAVSAARGKNTILLVQRDRISYRNLMQELEVLKLLGNKVLGVVIV